MGDTASRNLVAEPPRSHYGSLPTSNRETASKVNGCGGGVTSGTGIPLHIDLFFRCLLPCAMLLFTRSHFPLRQDNPDARHRSFGPPSKATWTERLRRGVGVNYLVHGDGAGLSLPARALRLQRMPRLTNGPRAWAKSCSCPRPSLPIVEGRKGRRMDVKTYSIGRWQWVRWPRHDNL